MDAKIPGKNPPIDREELGRIVRLAWIAWARESANPKADWVLPWEEMQEQHREADRRLGEAVQAAVLERLAARKTPQIGDVVYAPSDSRMRGVMTEGPIPWHVASITLAPDQIMPVRVYARVRWESGLIEWVAYEVIEKAEDE